MKSKLCGNRLSTLNNFKHLYPSWIFHLWSATVFESFQTCEERRETRVEERHCRWCKDRSPTAGRGQRDSRDCCWCCRFQASSRSQEAPCRRCFCPTKAELLLCKIKKTLKGNSIVWQQCTSDVRNCIIILNDSVCDEVWSKDTWGMK